MPNSKDIEEQLRAQEAKQKAEAEAGGKPEEIVGEPFHSDRSMAAQVRNALRGEQAKHQGEFPLGKLRPDDQGSLTIAVGQQAGRVVIAFPNPVEWIALDPEGAAHFAANVFHRARALGYIGPLPDLAPRDNPVEPGEQGEPQ